MAENLSENDTEDFHASMTLSQMRFVLTEGAPDERVKMQGACEARVVLMKGRGIT